MVGMLGIKIMNVDDNLTTQRIEAFTDAVFAIAITLLVLEIRLPEHGTTSTANLAKDLVKLIPSFLPIFLALPWLGATGSTITIFLGFIGKLIILLVC